MNLLLSFLIVEDSQMLLSLIKSRVCESGAVDVLTANNGKEALQVLNDRVAEGKTVDVIITDIVMPEMDGVEFLRGAKDLLNLKKVVTIVITSENSAERVKDAMTIPVDQYILKPFDNTVFGIRLRQAIGKKFSFAKP